MDYMHIALEEAQLAATEGEIPVGAVIVKDGTVIARAHNRREADHDPTAHAEVSAIRNACAELGTFDLSGAVLYTSCEPCPMCLAASLWARVGRVVFAADRYDAAGAGFDDAAFYEYFEAPGAASLMPVSQLTEGDGSEAMSPFNAWNAAERRTDY